MKKFLLRFFLISIVLLALFYAFVYFASYSEGIRAGKLVKFSHKGVVFKTWEGEISQGVSEAQVFNFSVESNETEVIENLKEFQGNFVKLEYKERFMTFPWLGDTTYFITKVELSD